MIEFWPIFTIRPVFSDSVIAAITSTPVTICLASDSLSGLFSSFWVVMLYTAFEWNAFAELDRKSVDMDHPKNCNLWLSAELDLGDFGASVLANGFVQR